MRNVKVKNIESTYLNDVWLVEDMSIIDENKFLDRRGAEGWVLAHINGKKYYFVKLVSIDEAIEG